MADLVDIQEKLSATSAALSRALHVHAGHPDDKGAKLNVKSLEKRQRILERSFLRTAELNMVNVCSYRIIPETSQPVTVATLTSVLGDFQAWISLAFQAIRNGPQRRGGVPQEIADKTALGFAYAFPGSAGFVFTLTNEQLLFGETDIDEAVKTILGMAKADSSEGIVAYARQLGPAPIRVMNSWAEHHAKAHVAASIDWHRGETVKTDLFMQGKEFQRLHDLISETSDTTEEVYRGRVTLVGADVTKRHFRAELPTGQNVSGKLASDVEITQDHTVELPRAYDVEIITRKTVKYSTEEEIIEHTLKSWIPVALS